MKCEGAPVSQTWPRLDWQLQLASPQVHFHHFKFDMKKDSVRQGGRPLTKLNSEGRGEKKDFDQEVVWGHKRFWGNLTWSEVLSSVEPYWVLSFARTRLSEPKYLISWGNLRVEIDWQDFESLFEASLLTEATPRNCFTTNSSDI